MNLVDLIQSQLSDQLLEGLSQQSGIGSKEKTKDATMVAAQAIIAALSKNTRKKDGASSLSGALERDHDGSILNDLAGLLLNQGQKQAPADDPMARMLNGAGILKHVLGEKQNGAVDLISQMAGLDKDKSANILLKMAPLVMGVLGKQKREQSLNPRGLADLLKSSNKTIKKRNPQSDLLIKLLDQDGDGSIADEATNFGLKFLGNLFKRKR